MPRAFQQSKTRLLEEHVLQSQQGEASLKDYAVQHRVGVGNRSRCRCRSRLSKCMAGKRILLVMQAPPLPFGTAAMGRWNYVLLRGLVKRGHHVVAFAACTSQAEVDQAKSLFSSGEYDLRCFLPDLRKKLVTKWRTITRPYSFHLGPDLRKDLNTEIAKGFDVLHLEVLWSGWATLPYAQRAVVTVPFLYQIDQADQPSSSYRERILRHRSYQAERYLLRHYRHIVGVSPRLAAHIRQIAPDSEVHAIPFDFGP